MKEVMLDFLNGLKTIAFYAIVTLLFGFGIQLLIVMWSMSIGLAIFYGILGICLVAAALFSIWGIGVINRLKNEDFIYEDNFSGR